CKSVLRQKKQLKLTSAIKTRDKTKVQFPQDKCVHSPPCLASFSRMYPAVATNNPESVEAMVQSAYLNLFSNGDRLFVPRIFNWAIDAFTGRYADYQSIDARYHDLEHTLQGTLCMIRLLAQRQATGVSPVLSQRNVEL